MIPYDPHGQVKHYLNDPAGNRLKTRIVEHEAAQAGTPDAQGEWSREGEYEDVFYRFDRAGNLIDRHDRRGALHLRWDANQRLIESRLEGVSTRYRYDPLGRRIEKRSGDQITAFAWDGDALVGDWIEDPTDPVVPAKGMAREWVYYPETFEPLALLGGRSGPNTLLHYHNDPNGCPIRLTDSKGEVLWAASYTAWGQIARLHVGYVDNPIRLQGQYEDGETGLNYNRHRYYDSVIGSFVSADPIGLAGGANCYHYASNALSWIDPYGLSCKIVGGKYEYYYRAMSRADFEHFLSTGKLKATTETFISPTRKFSEAYKGVLVKFQLAEGTTQALRDIGVRSHGKKSEALLPDLPQVKKGWARSKALFKPEGDQINIGLGKGRALDVFNQGIRGFEILGVNR